jgi:hypothetical protein
MIPKNKKYKNRSLFLQKQYDDNEYNISFNFIMKLNIDSTIKNVLNLMANDSFMNGSITWKQMTYSDKLGISRRQMVNIFNQLIDLKVIIPHKDNKKGGKKNTYTLTTNFAPLIKKPVGFGKKTCEAQCTLPVKPSAVDMCSPLHSTCETGFTYNTDNTCLIHVLKEEKDSLTESPLQEPKGPVFTEEAFNEFLNDTNL